MGTCLGRSNSAPNSSFDKPDPQDSAPIKNWAVINPRPSALARRISHLELQGTESAQLLATDTVAERFTSFKNSSSLDKPPQPGHPAPRCDELPIPPLTCLQMLIQLQEPKSQKQEQAPPVPMQESPCRSPKIRTQPAYNTSPSPTAYRRATEMAALPMKSQEASPMVVEDAPALAAKRPLLLPRSGSPMVVLSNQITAEREPERTLSFTSSVATNTTMDDVSDDSSQGAMEEIGSLTEEPFSRDANREKSCCGPANRESGFASGYQQLGLTTPPGRAKGQNKCCTAQESSQQPAQQNMKRRQPKSRKPYKTGRMFSGSNWEQEHDSLLSEHNRRLVESTS